MEKQHKFSIWYVLIGIWVVLLVQNYIASMFAVKTIPYSEFLSMLKNGKVVEIAITANQIQGKMIDENNTEYKMVDKENASYKKDIILRIHFYLSFLPFPSSPDFIKSRSVNFSFKLYVCHSRVAPILDFASLTKSSLSRLAYH